MPRLTPADLAHHRAALEEAGDTFLDPTVAQQLVPQLMREVEMLWKEVELARLQALREAAELVDGRLKELARRGPPGAEGHGCVHCHDAEARRFASALRDRAGAH